jgi:hypothetical protein
MIISLLRKITETIMKTKYDMQKDPFPLGPKVNWMLAASENRIITITS